LYELDPTGAVEPRLLSEGLGNVNGFDFATDGFLYGPRANGEIVRIDWEAGVVTDVIASGLGLPVAVREGPDGALYVLSAVPSPPTIHRVDIASGDVSEVATLESQLVDTFAIGDDGTFYVTAFDRPALIVVPPEGEPTEITIGDR
jgi:sugar lactone lactonase YvrE